VTVRLNYHFCGQIAKQIIEYMDVKMKREDED